MGGGGRNVLVPWVARKRSTHARLLLSGHGFAHHAWANQQDKRKFVGRSMGEHDFAFLVPNHIPIYGQQDEPRHGPVVELPGAVLEAGP